MSHISHWYVPRALLHSAATIPRSVVRWKQYVRKHELLSLPTGPPPALLLPPPGSTNAVQNATSAAAAEKKQGMLPDT